MASVRGQILDALETALRAEGKPNELTVFRSLARALRLDQLPALAIEYQGEGIADAHDTKERTLRVMVVCVFGDSGEDEQPIDAKVDPLTDWIEAAVDADPTLGGLAVHARVVGTTMQYENADLEYVGAASEITITYFTDRS